MPCGNASSVSSKPVDPYDQGWLIRPRSFYKPRTQFKNPLLRIRSEKGVSISMPAKETPAGPVHRRVPEGDNRERLVCDDCGFVNYTNPKIVVGTTPLWDRKVLLCRRAIEPRRGFWTMPAGFLEENETAEGGALRETREEANCDVAITGLLAVYSIPRISQVQLLFRADLHAPTFRPGPESSDVALFSFDALPWGELAFPSVAWALSHLAKVLSLTEFAPFTNPPGETGSLPEFVAKQQNRRPTQD